ncbi:MAG: hypothetical protein K0Q66_858 [Chitinophagaceae bacterium]|jgi:hypothetical protein|nr:hypothetical protein [Chitinophagaceae bacterium]
MRWLIIFLISSSVFLACSGKIPGDVIEPEKMKKIVWELMQADELAMQNKTGDSSLNLKNESFRLYDQVFALNKISRDKFQKSYRYYQEHPALYNQMMDAVKDASDKDRKTASATAQ